MRRRRKFMNRRKKRTVGTDYGFSRSLFLSILGVLLCMICLVSTTWAWFTDSVGSGGSMIKAANYDLAVMVEPINLTDSADITDNGGNHFSLTENKEYKITLTPTGDATTGYCKVKVGSIEYYTEQIAKGTSFVFQLIPPADPANAEGKCAVSFEAQWGTYGGSDGNKVQSGSTIGSIAPSEESSQDPQADLNSQDNPQQDQNPQDNPGGQGTPDTQVSPNPEGEGENPDTPDENTGGTNGSDENLGGQDEASAGQGENVGGQDGTSSGQDENSSGQNGNSGGAQETPGDETPSDGGPAGQSDNSAGASEGVTKPAP